jgi:hypothetical protein
MKLNIVAVAVVAVVSLAGCSSTTTTPAAKPAPVVAAVAKPSPAATSVAPSQTGPVAVGQPLTLYADKGQPVTVTLLKVDPAAVSLQSQDDAPAGSRFFAAQFRFANPGKVAYVSTPANNGASVTDTAGQQYTVNPSGKINALSSGVQLQPALNVPAGGSVTGWMLFVVPTGVRIVQVQIGVASMMGLVGAGTWKIT